MDLDRSGWTQKDPDGLGRTQTVSDGPGQTQVDPDGPGWVPLGSTILMYIGANLQLVPGCHTLAASRFLIDEGRKLLLFKFLKMDK